MNAFEKSESIKAGLRQGFQDGSSKMARRRCYGYMVSPDGNLEIDPDEAQVICWIFERYLAGDSLGKIAAGLEQQSIPSQQVDPSGTKKQSTSCFPMKNTPGMCCFKKRSAPAFLRLKTMASWIGISTPMLMRP